MAPYAQFSVDTFLLDELGERLVGQPSIALAELIKNSYDADATKVEVIVDPESDLIEIRDNGHGMTKVEFEEFWMRVGTRHKIEREYSQYKGRPLTGSKGIGRIAARILSDEMTLTTIGKGAPKKRLTAQLDWKKATQQSEELTKVRVAYSLENCSPNTPTGTTISLKKLRDEWNEEAIKELAKQIWYLQPPLTTKETHRHKSDFAIEFHSPLPGLREKFDKELNAILDVWSAKINGKVRNGKNEIVVEFKGQNKPSKYKNKFECSDASLEGIEYEIRVYRPKGKQPHGLKVTDVRNYLEDFGGVQIYDVGFRIPLYGEKESDWLNLNFDHARSLTRSNLLPKDLQIERAMLSMPRNTHLLGGVFIDTRQHEGLRVPMSRDRLEATSTFVALRDTVRISIDYYTQLYVKHQKKQTESLAKRGEVVQSAKSAVNVLEAHKKHIPEPIYEDLKSAVQETVGTTRVFEQKAISRTAVLGSLATAGITAVAYQHEIDKRMGSLRNIIDQLRVIEDVEYEEETLHEIADGLENWMQQTETLQRLLSHLLDAENVQNEEEYSAKIIVRESWRNTEPVAYGVKVDFGSLNKSMKLPRATFAEWVSVFQNIFYNAVNAMLESRTKTIRILSEESKKNGSILIMDTGHGVDLKDSEKLFDPFVRKAKLSKKSRKLRLGGTGLGLTIVRMICEERGVDVRFVKPRKGYATAIKISW